MKPILLALVSAIAVMFFGLACTEPSSTPDPRLDALEQRVSVLEGAVSELKRETPTQQALANEEITEALNIQAAIESAMADLGLVAVDARYYCNDFSSTGGCGLTGGTVPSDFLYPSYLRIQTTGAGRSYRWDRTGLVSLQESGLETEREKVQVAIDAAMALRGLTAVDSRSGCTDFSSRGGCGLTGGGNPDVFLYPSYLQIRFPMNGSYSWNAAGLVTSP